MDLDAAFAALADPTRRAVIRALGDRPQRAGQLAALVGMSAPALSRHLRVLRRAGLIVEAARQDDARVRVYSLAPKALTPARAWLEEIDGFWMDQLSALKGRRRS